MVGAGDVLLMACTWRGSRPSFRAVSTARIIPPVIEYQFTQGNGSAAAGGGLNGFRAAGLRQSGRGHGGRGG